MIARSILDFADKKFNEAVEEDDYAVSARKAFMSGVVEGAVDVLFIVGGICWPLAALNLLHVGRKK